MAKRKTVFRAPFLKSLTFLPERFQGDRYPFNLPILEGGRLQIVFDRPITFFVGDNGTGKSTLQDPAHHLERLFSEPFASDDAVNSD